MSHSVAQRCSTSSSTATRRSDVAQSARSAAVRPFTARRPAASAVVSQPLMPVVSKPAHLQAPRVAASESASATAASGTQEWHALVCNCEFFFNDVQNESIAEQLRERVRFFKEIGRESDFFIVPEPQWLDAKYPQLAKQVKRPCVALVSTDKMWITFMKLRLDRVAMISLTGMSTQEALAAGGKVPEFKKPEKWVAPYAPYTSGWWEVFLPKQ